MKNLRLAVRRSILKTMILGILGLPLVFIAIDYIWGTFGFLDLFGAWAYASKDVEPFEARDDIFVALLAIIGLTLVLFALREFIAPRRVLVADEDGLKVPLRGPLRRPDGISWYQIRRLRAEEDTLIIELSNRAGLPEDPWGARWDDDGHLLLDTTWWDRRPDAVLGRIRALGFRPMKAPEPLLTPELREAIAEASGGDHDPFHEVDDTTGLEPPPDD